MASKYDFAGWVTKNDLLCSDGRTIRRDAFKDCDGTEVPLVYHHDHSDPTNILGKVLLENRPEGVFGYATFNETEKAQHAKEAVRHGDIKYLSIYANKLKQNAGDVLHGMIREVSLVMTGANPGARIETAFGHAEEFDEEAVITTGEELSMYDEEYLNHEDEDDESEGGETIEAVFNTLNDKQKKAVYAIVGMALEGDNDGGEAVEHADSEDDDEDDDGETIEAVFNTLSEKQKKAVYAIVGMALENENGSDDEDDEDDEAAEHGYYEGEDDMKYNAFETGVTRRNTISHEDFDAILSDAKRCGSLKDAVLAHMEDEDGVLYHAFPDGGIPTTGMTVSTNEQQYMVNQPSFLFPEYKSLNNPPEWIKRDTGWVSKVMSKVGHTPFSRIKSVFADITEDEARAKGYMKTHLKTEEVFSLLKRTTDPQTIYKKQKMDRDDIIDITDFDVVRWIKGEMRLMLEEEIARAILIGDGRLNSSDDKISEDHVRPVVNDKPLFTVQCPVTVPGNGTPSDKAEAFIETAIRSRKYYKGSGNPDLYTTEDMLTEMLLLKDGIGHRLYKTEAELATTLRVNSIITVEVMEGFQLNSKEFLGVIVNLADYRVGADRGGEINLFDDFDIDYNQQKYLIETRISGALVKPFSALSFTVATA